MWGFVKREWVIGSVFFILCVSACQKEGQVEYREETEEETATATKDIFASQDSGEAEDIPPEIDRFFENLGLATRADREVVIDDHLSLTAMLQSMKSSGMLDSFNSQELRDFKKGFRRGANRSFGTTLRQMSYDKHRILKVERINENERLVYVRHYDNELNVTTQLRWWLVQTDDGWRIYDFEELSVGLRVVSLMGTMISNSLGAKPQPWVADFIVVAQKIQTVDFTDIDSYLTLDEPTEKLRQHDLPPDIKRFASMMRTNILQVKGDAEGSIAELHAALEGGYIGPLHHYLMGHSLVMLEKYDEALQAFAKHAEVLGWDSDVLESVSDCHFHLGDTKAARQAALDGLADNPASINCLCSLAAASTPEEITGKEFRDLVDQCGDPAVGFELAFDYILEMNLLPQAEAMLSIMDQYLTDEELRTYYHESVGELRSADPE